MLGQAVLEVVNTVTVALPLGCLLAFILLIVVSKDRK